MNGIENDVQDVADLIRVNMVSKTGREIAARYNVSAVPTTLVVDSSGEVIYQHAGIPNRRTVVEAVTGQAVRKL